ncbi:MAG: HAMP domain-containing histidine kinase [Bacteroidales bacterium]|nr:HAMP domain-containing histidine kinase [Bacteroidales bacterium]
METALVIAIVVIVAGFVGWTVFHQQLLSTRAYLMREALRNKDFSFHMPTNGLLQGERDMQKLLNDLGHEIQKQVDQNEVESWQKLTRVLTHEIMNDVTPISSICQSLMKRPELQNTSTGEGLKAIAATSDHLISFVDSYRKLAQLQKPQKTIFDILKTIEEIASVYSDITFDIDAPQGAMINADTNLMRHVITNIVKNAHEAGATKIGLRYQEKDNHTTLLISNNGQPISSVNAGEIFTPFFTTKSTGSGIGLSLSRQIIVSQGGRLVLRKKAEPNYGVTFEIILPQ